MTVKGAMTGCFRSWAGEGLSGRSRALVPTAIAILVTAIGLAALPSAASASAIALNAPGQGQQPLVAFDATGNVTYVAWNAVKDGTDLGIDMCVFPQGASTCEGGGPVLLTDPKFPAGDTAPVLTGLNVVPESATVVVLGAAAQGIDGTVAWASIAGGSDFFATGHGLQRGGEPISQVSSDYQPGNAVSLGGTALAILDPEGNHFSETPYDATATAPSRNADGAANYSSYPLGAVPSPQIGAEPTPGASGKETVVTVGQNNTSSPANPPCANAYATGFGVRVGSSASMNGIAAPNYRLLACSANTPVLTSGGSSGIGVVEQEGDGIAGTGSTFTIDYRPFNATSTGGTFGNPVQIADVSADGLDGVSDLVASTDPGAGIYALWEDSQGAVLDYSANGGGNWGPPVVTPAPYASQEDIAGLSSGNAAIVYNSNPSGDGDQDFLEFVNYQSLEQPTPVAISTIQTSISPPISASDLEILGGTTPVIDRATLTGANVGTATGTITYRLYSSPTCAASSDVFSSTESVSYGIAPASAPVVPLHAGEYYWRASYSGNPSSYELVGNQAAMSACGSEVLTVIDPMTPSHRAKSNGKSLTLTVTCLSAPCKVRIRITAKGRLAAFGAAVASKNKRIKITLAKGTFTLTRTGKVKLTLRLTGKGKRLLKADHGRLTATIAITDRTPGGLVKVVQKLHITSAKAHHTG